MKIKSLVIFLAAISLFIFSNSSFAAIQGGSSTLGDGSGGSSSSGASSYKSFSENSLGAGLSAGVRFNLAEDIFTESEEESKVQSRKSKVDHIFTELEVFGSQFLSGEIKHNFGGRLNLGYEIYGVRIYGSGGYAISAVDYQQTGQAKQSVNKGAPFFGLGLGYDITKNIGIRLNSMFYNFDFTPKNSEFKNVEVNVAAATLGLALHF
jgi:hypothetical protein